MRLDLRKILLMLVLCTLSAGCHSKAVQPEQTPASTQPEQNPAPEEFTTNEETSPQPSGSQELLSHINVKDGYAVAEYGESAGNDYSYAVCRFIQDDRPEDDAGMYWEVFVLDGEQMVTVLRIEEDEHGNAFPPASELVLEYDVNFDGVNDILLCLGHFGNQGLVAYKSYLAGNNTFTHCPSFTDIANPAVDSDAHIVRSQWRNWAASHSWAVYTCQDNVFTMTECLTESLKIEEDGTETWFWKDEILKDGEWQIREEYTEHDYDPETLYQKRCGPDSHWGLDQEKWNTLFNGGKMSDFSIYAS